MKTLATMAKKYRYLIGGYILMGLIRAFLNTFSSSSLQNLIDHFTLGDLRAWHITVYGSALILLYIFNYLDEYPARKLENGIRLSLKTTALKKLAVIDYLAYTKLGTGKMIQRIENGAQAGTAILFSYYLHIAAELLPAMVFSIGFIFSISRAVTLAIGLGYIAVFLIANLLLKALYKVKLSILSNEEQLNHILVRGFMEMVVFRINRRFARESEKAQAAADEIVSAKIKIAMIHEAFFTIFAVMIGFVKIGVIIYGWQTKLLTIGEIIALIALVDNAYTPIAIFNVVYVQYKLDKVAYGRFADFIDGEDERGLTQGDVFTPAQADITLTQVTFAYEESKLFDGLDLRIHHGHSTALVGESGSGKSTVMKLLTGLLHPQGGRVCIGDCDLGKVDLRTYYPHIAYLPQEPSIFDGTLRENLVFDDIVDDAKLVDALDAVGLTTLLARLPNGMDTQLGERGVSLSGGERQQLALARLWFSTAQLVLLDEATSAIDNLTEARVMKNVMHHLSGRTVVAVAHRLDSIRDFDTIVVFDKGQIIETGQFDDLLQGHTHFSVLYNRLTKA